MKFALSSSLIKLTFVGNGSYLQQRTELRASSYEPGWPGMLGYRDEIGVCSYGDFQPASEMKILKKWWRDHSGVKSNEQAWREFLDFLCLNNLKFLLTSR